MSTAHPPSETDPVAISDFMLEVTREAYLAGDFTAFAQWFHLPQIVGTFDGDRVLETWDDLRAIYDAMCAQMAMMGATDMYRRTIEARFIAPDRIQATFVTRHLLPSTTLGEEIVAHGILGNIDGRWQIMESRYASPDPNITKALHAQADRHAEVIEMKRKIAP